MEHRGAAARKALRVWLTFVALGAAVGPPLALAAQQSGHSTVPATGPAAPGGFPAAGREEDEVLARVESLRRELGDLGKAYKKEKGAARAARRAELLGGLERASAEVSALRTLLAAPPASTSER